MVLIKSFHLLPSFTVLYCHWHLFKNYPKIEFCFIQKAKKKKLDKKSVKDLGVDISPRIEILETVDPPVREAGIVVEDVDALIGKLKEQGFVKS